MCTAKTVTACDFMEVSIAENKCQHAHLGNVSFLVADVTELNQVGWSVLVPLESFP